MLFIHSVNSLTGAPCQDWPMSPSYHWYKCSFISWGQRKGRAARERDDSTATLWRNTKRILLVEICWAQYVVTLCCVFAPCRACFLRHICDLVNPSGRRRSQHALGMRAGPILVCLRAQTFSPRRDLALPGDLKRWNTGRTQQLHTDHRRCSEARFTSTYK